MKRRIVAIGGAGFTVDPEQPLLERFLVSQAREPTPNVCFVPTASGDASEYLLMFHRAFSQLGCRTRELLLFQRSIEHLEDFVLSQDVIYVGGGNTANLLAIWRVHGLDRILRHAWEEGIVLCGSSAGMNCWFAQSVTDSFSTEHLHGLSDGLGLIGASACPHYDGEPLRRPTYERLVGTGELIGGWAADEGAALVFDDDRLEEVVSSRPTACAYRIDARDGGGIEEQRLPARYLGE